MGSLGVIGGRVPVLLGEGALKEVGNDDQVGLAENIGALDGLGAEGEDVVDPENSFFGGAGPGNI